MDTDPLFLLAGAVVLVVVIALVRNRAQGFGSRNDSAPPPGAPFPPTLETPWTETGHHSPHHGLHQGFDNGHHGGWSGDAGDAGGCGGADGGAGGGGD